MIDGEDIRSFADDPEENWVVADERRRRKGVPLIAKSRRTQENTQTWILRNLSKFNSVGEVKSLSRKLSSPVNMIFWSAHTGDHRGYNELSTS
jgi:hypothetical protein